MINIKNPKCIICNNIRPIFGMINDKKPQYCKKCKLDGMIDIINRKCLKCNNSEKNFEPYNTLSINLPEDSSVSLDECLKNYFEQNETVVYLVSNHVNC